jgi:hypothetical protein
MRCRLDVGGQRFAVSKATLVARPNTFFEAMFGGRFNTKPEKDGSYFIDRYAMALSEPPTLNFGLLTGVCGCAMWWGWHVAETRRCFGTLSTLCEAMHRN